MEPGPTRPKQQRLCAHALKLKEKKNNPLLFNYVFNKDEKRRNSAIQTAWKMKNATAMLERQNKNFMTILEELCNAQTIVLKGGFYRPKTPCS